MKSHDSCLGVECTQTLPLPHGDRKAVSGGPTAQVTTNQNMKRKTTVKETVTTMQQPKHHNQHMMIDMKKNEQKRSNFLTM